MEENKIVFQLSKSTFLRGKQCLKSLFLNKFYKHLRDKISEEKKAIFKRGTDIGLLAQQLFPEGINATPVKSFDYASSISVTQKALQKEEVVIYEATFVYQEVLMAADVFVKKNNTFFAYEVKSATKVSETYIWDAALQYYVLKGNGILLNDFFIITINSSYIRKGNLEIEKLFTRTSVIKEVIALQEQIEQSVQQFKQVLSAAEIPTVQIGTHCTSPYECDFMGYCWKEVPEGSVFELSNTNNTNMAEMYYSGIKRIAELPDNFECTAIQKVQIKAEKDQTDVMNEEALRYFTDKLIYPLYFVDFETFMPTIPIYDNTHPFQHLPFQFSIHLIHHVGEEAIHSDFVAFPGADPRKEFIEELIKQIGTQGAVLVYNAQFERSVLNALAKNFPQYLAPINSIMERIVDLMEPFRKREFYFLEMRGSHSIKKVLPAVFKEMHYKQLAISNGNEASRVYENLRGETDIFKIEETIQNLKEYCKLDTIAMVKIVEFLQKITK
ncbi:MAG: DUF2779 domain-containing protein [Bacteroidetes bacterium]|nr:DUF2779 domain-containing protein [Bacteroidota bacterium]NOG94456.1 DUF2779 domain-containing protein [Bacteroidota bacterium]